MLSIRRLGAVSALKSSIMTGRSSQELEANAEAACAIEEFTATRVAAKRDASYSPDEFLAEIDAALILDAHIAHQEECKCVLARTGPLHQLINQPLANWV
jgi:hypothetical protein